jgi:hypothetical protein
MLQTAMPIAFEPAPMPEASGPNWTAILFGLCIVVAVGVAGWLLYTRYYKKKNNTNAGNNRGGNRGGNGTAGRRANNNNASRLDANEFGEFGDLDAPGTAR